MTTSANDDRRHVAPSHTRGHLRLVWDMMFGVLRLIARHASNAYAVFGIFLLSGAAVAVLCTWAFSEIAARVNAGATQSFDDGVLRWMSQHQSPGIQSAMLDITALGTSTVVTMVVLIGGMFLWLNRHRHSAVLLVAATLGGMILDGLLKVGFNRPRPQIFTWGTFVTTPSFPSGHAMASTIVYSTVAYLAARLQQNVLSRLLTMVLAAIIIAAIGASRLYLGVHYPSDVAAGVIIGLAWAGFCMALLEAAQLYAKRNAPQMLDDERPAPAGASPSS